MDYRFDTTSVIRNENDPEYQIQIEFENKKNVKLDNCQVIEIPPTINFPSLVQLLEKLDLNLTLEFAIIEKGTDNIYVADKFGAGLAVLESLQSIWLLPNMLEVWGSFDVPPTYDLNFSKAKKITQSIRVPTQR